MTRLRSLRVTALPPSPPSSPPQPSPSPNPATTSHDPPTPLRHPPLSKNLRWTAVALVSKLSKELERPSADIADEVALAATRDMLRRFPGRDVAPVERNTRRRVYDALKVMVAVGCIQRYAKNLRWIGIDHLRHPVKAPIPNLRVALCESRRRIGKKKARILELTTYIQALESLYLRHKQDAEWHTQEGNRIRTAHRINFPVTLVKGRRVDSVHSKDRTRITISTHYPFVLYSETDLACLLAEKAAMKKPKPPRKRRHSKQKEPPTKKRRKLPPLPSATEQPDNTLVQNQQNPIVRTEKLTQEPKEEPQKEPQKTSKVQPKQEQTLGPSSLVLPSLQLLPQQITICNIFPQPPSHPTSSPLPSEHDEDPIQSLICNEQLGIPELQNEESSASDCSSLEFEWRNADKSKDGIQVAFKSSTQPPSPMRAT